MSDKYYLHDCNSYTPSCRNSYRVECRDIKAEHKPQDEKVNEQASAKWWQRLFIRDVQPAQQA